MKRDWLRVLSPCVITAGISLIFMINSVDEFERSEGWSMVGVLLFAPLFLYVVVVDILVKGLFKLNTAQIWLLELGLIGLGYIVFWIFVMNGLQLF